MNGDSKGSRPNDINGRTEAAEILRSQIDRITITSDSRTGKLAVDLEGDLLGILSLSQTNKNVASVTEDDVSQLMLVAGVGFEPTTFRL